MNTAGKPVRHAQQEKLLDFNTVINWTIQGYTSGWWLQIFCISWEIQGPLLSVWPEECYSQKEVNTKGEGHGALLVQANRGRRKGGQEVKKKFVLTAETEEAMCAILTTDCKIAQQLIMTPDATKWWSIHSVDAFIILLWMWWSCML